MINFDIIFEATQQQREAIIPLKQKWTSLLNINQMSPENLLELIEEFARTLNLKTLDDLVTASNPNAGFLDQEAYRMFWNILETYRQRLGTSEAEQNIVQVLSRI
jgi:hypothetical protein